MLPHHTNTSPRCAAPTPRVFPTVEQLEERCVPSAAAPAHPATAVHMDAHDAQTLPAVVQAVRVHVDRVDSTIPPTVVTSVAAVPPAGVNVPQAVPFEATMIALPAEMPPAPEAAAIGEVLDQAQAVEPAAPPTEPVAQAAAVVVITAVEQETYFVVPAVVDYHPEPVRAPLIPLTRPAQQRVAMPEAAAMHDHLPMLVWMVGMASLVALRAERRRGTLALQAAG